MAVQEGFNDIPVSLPRENPTKSYWQTPPADIADLRSTDELPARADYVIVGSGISGATIAFELLDRKPEAKVVLLEARQACSGATGRNGGHTKPASYRAFLENEKAYGREEAIRISQLEFSNRTHTIAFAKKHNIDCDLNPCTTADIIYDQTQLDEGKHAIAAMMAACPPGTTERYTILSASEARAKHLTPDALGAFESEAGSVQPYKFVTGTLKLSIARGLNLQTNTPVTKISQDPSLSSSPWTAHTPRGSITTPHLILATNGYTPHLLPETQGVIVPLRGQMSVQRPGSGLPNHGSLDCTYSFVYSNGYEYMIPRPIGSTHAGDICIGGGLFTLPANGASEFGNTNDTELNPALSTYLKDCTGRYFGENWGEDDKEGRVRMEWTGVMGCSADGLPYVGPFPGKKGLWVSVSFNGHGMSLALNSARGLVQMVCGEEGESLYGWFPRAYVVTEERLKKRFSGLH